MKMADRFPELSETDLTSVVDQENSENTKNATVIDKAVIELGYREIS